MRRLSAEEIEKLSKKPESKPFDGETMPFGKHKGEKIEDIPYDYLEWAVGNLFEGEVLDALKAEYDRRWM